MTEPREISLNAAEWQLCPDPLNRGISEKWGEAPPTDEPWFPTPVPGTIQHTLGPDFRGVAWYRLRTRLTKGWNSLRSEERLRLRFEAAATDARVWINGQFIGRHLGDFIPFEFEATQAMLSRGGEIDLLVRIDQLHAPRPAKGVITEHGHIGKGFHDVLSVQHAGLWGNVTLRRTGAVTIRPGGLTVRTGPAASAASLELELDGESADHVVTFSINDPAGTPVGSGVIELQPGQRSLRYELVGEQELRGPLALWSPDSPSLYTLTLDITPASRPAEPCETHQLRFGFRTASLGGPRNRRILLNGIPIQLRGVLHWGHEPSHLAPAPTPEQVRAEFTELKLRGFNCVCLCMVYMPEYYYQLADEMGMLLWQEHPVWKAPMGDEFLPEYQRLYAEYFRRDRQHPSVILVSGSCEHEMFNPALAQWWWDRAARELPGTLRQVQTAFFAWADPDQTDLYDEHTYDNSGRWADYLSDVRAAIDALPQPDKPFIMGETILSNAWPDIPALRARQRSLTASPTPLNRPASVGAAAPAAPWWITRGLDECEALEHSIAARWGEPTLLRFRRQAHRHNLNLRKFQSELFRADPGNAGWIMNHIRDVPACRCGFMDDLDTWRYQPHELREFLSDSAFLLASPGHARAFHAGEIIKASLQLCNFSPRDLEAQVQLSVIIGGRTAGEQSVTLRAARGEVASAPVSLGLFETDRPTAITIRAESPGLPENQWTLWLLPRQRSSSLPTAIYAAPDLTSQERALEFEERKYSSGWGLLCRTWSPRHQIPRELLPTAPTWTPGDPAPSRDTVILTHRLTPQLIEHLESGGRVVLLASRAQSALDARIVMQWAGVPLVIEQDPASTLAAFTPFTRGQSDAAVDLLHHDLARHTQRMIPTQELGLAERVDPIIRFVHTHDSGRPTIYDAAFAAVVGAGTLIVSTLDHATSAGQWLLDQLIALARREDRPTRSIPPGQLRACIDRASDHTPAP